MASFWLQWLLTFISIENTAETIYDSQTWRTPFPLRTLLTRHSILLVVLSPLLLLLMLRGRDLNTPLSIQSQALILMMCFLEYFWKLMVIKITVLIHMLFCKEFKKSLNFQHFQQFSIAVIKLSMKWICYDFLCKILTSLHVHLRTFRSHLVMFSGAGIWFTASKVAVNTCLEAYSKVTLTSTCILVH